MNADPANVHPLETPPSRRNLWLAGLLLILVAGSLRFVNLGGPALWEDEVYTYIASGDLIAKQLQWQGTRAFPHPPMIYLECKAARILLGDSEFAMRVPAAMWGIVTVIALFLLVGRHVGWVAGFFAALIMAIHPAAVEWSRDARMYSQWLALTILLMALAMEAWRYARTEQATPLDWRWWFMGIAFMIIHVYAMVSITTIAAVEIWLGLMAITEWRRNRRAARTMLFGGAIAFGVYLCSWALPGIGSILGRLGQGQHAPKVDLWGELSATLEAATSVFGGHLATPLAIVFIGIGIAGVIRLMLVGKMRFALLATMVAGFAWATFPSVIKQHFFAPRYVIIDLIALSLGWGCCLSWLATNMKLPALAGRRVAAGMICIALAAGWASPLYSISTMARADFGDPFKNIASHAEPDDVMICYPEWYSELRAWYKVGDNITIATLPEDFLVGSQPVSQTGEMIRGHDKTFESLFTINEDGTVKGPKQLWILFVTPRAMHKGKTHLENLEALLTKYQFKGFDQIKEAVEKTPTAMVWSFRIDTEGVSHIVSTESRWSVLK